MTPMERFGKAASKLYVDSIHEGVIETVAEFAARFAAHHVDAALAQERKEIAEYFERLQAEHKDGQMMSMAEAVNGQICFGMAKKFVERR